MNSDPCARRFMETYLWRTPQLKRTDTEPVGRGLGEEQGEEGGGGGKGTRKDQPPGGLCIPTATNDVNKGGGKVFTVDCFIPDIGGWTVTICSHCHFGYRTGPEKFGFVIAQ